MPVVFTYQMTLCLFVSYEAFDTNFAVGTWVPMGSRSTDLRTVPRFDPSEEVVGITDPLGYFDPLGFAKVGDFEGPLGKVKGKGQGPS